MENSSNGNRLPSAKWSRNLNEDCQSEANRLRLLERQRQILETKLQRRQQQSTSSGVVLSRPATSVAGARTRIVRQSSSEGLLDSPSSVVKVGDEAIHDTSGNVKSTGPRLTNTATPRPRTSIAGTRTLASLESPSSPTSSSSSTKSQNASNLQYSPGTPSKPIATTAKSTPVRSNVRENRSLNRSEASLTAAVQRDQSKTVRDVISPNPLTTILSDDELLKFVSQPVPSEVTLHCTIIRDKKGLDRSLYPTYYMHLQDIVLNSADSNEVPTEANDLTDRLNAGNSRDGTATVWMSESVDSLESIKSNEDDTGKEEQNGIRSAANNESSTSGQNELSSTNNGLSNLASNSKRKIFILSGRRRKKSKTYLIGNNAFDISRDRCIAKLKSNVLGTQFTAIRLHQSGVRYEIASITYETNVLGFKGPRKMTIIIPKTDEKINVLCHLSLQEEFKRNSRAISLLKNKTPIWNEETQSYVLNFHGRVTQASVKNFQLVIQDSAQSMGKTGNVNEMRRSASSHQLRQRYRDSDSGTESNINDVEQIDDDDDDPESNDEEFESRVAYTRTSINQQARPLSKSLSRSGNLMASSSEDAKAISAESNEMVSLQFGRVSNIQFSCDVSWPLSPLQAFAIALSSFDSKLACE